MRAPLSWLAEYVDLPPAVTVAQLHAALVSVGLEEEAAHSFDVHGPVVVGEVLDFVPEAHSNGRTIRWCQVRVAAGPGTAEAPAVRGIVCGADNFVVGDKVVVALPGAVLPGPFPIAARKTYGHVSDGMIASARELGLGEEHSGILRLTTLGLDPDVGADALTLLGLNDSAVEVNVTPDRGYALSIRGIAREYAHATGASFRDPAAREPLAPASGFPVSIADAGPLRGSAGVRGFSTRAVRGINPAAPSPPWLISRLTLAGIRSRSLIVDITNYVMLELGQPLHAYDLHRLRGGITVRRAAAGEQLVTLDSQRRTLHEEDLLITDESGPIGLAGVMGGAGTEIGAATTDVLLEAATFDSVSVARTARRHRLPSEASRRFERGVDPNVALPALARAAELLADLGGGSIDSLGSDYRSALSADPIWLPEDFVSGLIGVDYTAAEIRDTLLAIGCTVTDVAGGLTVVPPSWRPDLVDAAGLAEEVARLGGYQRIPAILPVAPPGRGLTREQKLRRNAAAVLAANGATEVLTFPFVGAEANQRFGPGNSAAITVANPLDSAANQLRSSLLPGLLSAVKRNRERGLLDLALFEIGLVFLADPGARYGTGTVPPVGARPSVAVLAELDGGIPPQPRHAAVVLAGAAVPRQPGQPLVSYSWQDALTAAQQVAAAVRVPLQVAQAQHPAFHPGRTGSLSVPTPAGPVLVGYAGEVLPDLVAAADVSGVVAALEVDLDAMIRLATVQASAQPIRSLPAATQDLSVLVAEQIPAGDVLGSIREGAGDLLEQIRLVDDYRGDAVPAGSKSLTFALRFRAADRTLTAAEASAAKNAGLTLAAERFSATLRE